MSEQRPRKDEIYELQQGNSNDGAFLYFLHCSGCSYPHSEIINYFLHFLTPVRSWELHIINKSLTSPFTEVPHEKQRAAPPLFVSPAFLFTESKLASSPDLSSRVQGQQRVLRRSCLTSTDIVLIQHIFRKSRAHVVLCVA